MNIIKTNVSIIRLAGIDAVMVLCHIDDKIDKSDIIIQEKVADTIMAFLPGIVSGLQEIAMGSEVQNHKVTMVIHNIFIYTDIIIYMLFKIRNKLFEKQILIYTLIEYYRWRFEHGEESYLL